MRDALILLISLLWVLFVCGIIHHLCATLDDLTAQNKAMNEQLVKQSIGCE